MSLTRITEIGGSQGIDTDDKNVKNYTRSWLIETNSKDDTIATVEAYAGWPQIGWSHPLNAAAKCIRRNCKYEEPTALGAFYTFMATYSTKYDQNQQNPNPLERPVRRYVRASVTEDEIYYDGDGVMLTNSAGDRPLDPPKRKIFRPIFCFERNESDIPVDRMLQYYFATNADEFYGAPTGTLLCTIECGQQQVENDVPFYVVVYCFEYYKSAADLKIRFLNIGFNARTAAGKKIRVAGGEPRLLTAQNGNPNQVGHTKFLAAGGTAEFCERPLYSKKPFSVFGL